MTATTAAALYRAVGIVPHCAPPMNESPSPTGPVWPARLWNYFRRGPAKLAFLQHAAAHHGPVVELSLAPPFQRTWLLTEPDDIGHVLQNHHLHYRKTTALTSATGRRRSGTGLLTGTGQAAITQKRLLQPVLAQAITPRLEQLITDTTAEWLNSCQPADWLDALPAMTTLTRRILGQALLSVDFEQPHHRPLAAAIATRQRYLRFVYESRLPEPERWPTRIRREYRRATEVFDNAIYPLIAARRRDPTPPADLLTMFLAARYSDGSAMTDQQVRDEVLTMTTTGYETVALALAWTLYLTARHPAAQRRLADPVGAELVFAEALRLYPPTWIFVRVPEQDDTLPSGVPVRAGTKLYLSPYVTHRDDRFFPRPADFDPDRFTDTAKQARPRFAYFPFSAGPRVCLGQGFAMLEVTRILAAIAQRFAWEPGEDVAPFPGQFLFPDRPIRTRWRAL